MISLSARKKDCRAGHENAISYNTSDRQKIQVRLRRRRTYAEHRKIKLSAAHGRGELFSFADN